MLSHPSNSFVFPLRSGFHSSPSVTSKRQGVSARSKLQSFQEADPPLPTRSSSSQRPSQPGQWKLEVFKFKSFMVISTSSRSQVSWPSFAVLLIFHSMLSFQTRGSCRVSLYFVLGAPTFGVFGYWSLDGSQDLSRRILSGITLWIYSPASYLLSSRLEYPAHASCRARVAAFRAR